MEGQPEKDLLEDKDEKDDLVELEDTEQKSKEKYGRMMFTEVHKPKDSGVDPETGWRWQVWDIGMTRNAAAEHRKDMKVFIDPIPHIVLDQNVPLRGWYQSKYEPDRVRPRPCFTDAILTQPMGGFCAVGCAFCYINNGVRGYRAQNVTTVDPEYPIKITKQLKSMRTGAAVYMSSFIDPFLEIEHHYHNTQRTAEAAVNEGLPIFFLTRKKAPGWAYDLLKKSKYSYMQFSINTSDPEDWHKLSPNALSLMDMYDQVKEMHKQGIYVSIQVNPIVAGIVSNEDIVRLIHKLARRGADHLIFKFVEIVYSSIEGMKKQMRLRFKDRADKFEALFTQNIGGFRTIDEDYRKEGLKLFWKECKKAGITMSLCYEYQYERDAKGEIVDHRGISMGKDFISSDQCHGHRVPLFTRKTPDAKFTPFEPCPTTGCLHCADETKAPTKVPCGNEVLAHAPALTTKMLQYPVEPEEGYEPREVFKSDIKRYRTDHLYPKRWEEFYKKKDSE